MRTAWGTCVGSIVCALGLLAWPSAQTPVARRTLFEGARLVTGEPGTVIERAAFLVENDRVARVGRSGSLEAPAGTARVDVSGKTVIPALVNAHIHLGYDRGATFAAENYTRENILDQLNHYAYAGVAAVVSLGTDSSDLVFGIRREQERGTLGGARALSAGSGLAAPNAGPASAAMRPSAHGVTNEAEARQAVRAEIARGVPFVKIWVDDRNGTVPKLSSSLYKVIVDEAHRAKTPVIAHVFYLEDLRELVRAGVDGFAHLPRDLAIDEALAKEMKTRGAFVLPNLAISENGTHEGPPDWLSDPLLRDLIAAEDLQRLHASYERRSAEGVARARVTYGRMQESVKRLKAAGVTIGFGTDGGAVRDHVHAFTDHRELQLMVEAGLSPLEALVAATGTSATLTGQTTLGRVAAGMTADFVVLDGNPLEDIRATRRIVSVYSKGIEINRPALRAAWGR